MYKVTSLALITTLKCTAACKNCCFECNPHRHETMTLSEMLHYIDEAKNHPSTSLIVFTGGECTIYFRELAAAIKYANGKGLFTRIVSNGWFGNNKQRALKLLRELKENGLTEINFSIGDDHQEYIPIGNVINSAVISSQLGLLTAINVEFVLNQRLTSQSVISQLKEEGADMTKILITSGAWVNFGDPEDARHPSECFRFDTDKSKGCTTMINTMGVMPGGKIISCCGLQSHKIKELAAGNLLTESLREIEERVKNDLVAMWLIEEGPEAMVEFAQDCNPGISFNKKCVHPCQTCLQLFENEEVKKTLLANFEKKKGDLIFKAFKNSLFNETLRVKEELVTQKIN